MAEIDRFYRPVFLDDQLRVQGATTLLGPVTMSVLALVTFPAMTPGGTAGVYAGTRTLARLFQPALAVGGQAQGENAFGPGAGNSTMTNGAVADLALASANTAMGFDALIAATTAEQNTAYGHRALKALTTGKYNVAIGGGALLNNATNIGNVALGTSALLTLTASGGDYNTGLGHDALEMLQTGTMNTAVGKRSNWQMTAGSSNTSVGGDSLFSNLTGGSNVAIGAQALSANLADANTAVGTSAMVSNTSGTENCAVGRAALLNTTASSSNTAIGNLAGRYQADATTALTAANASVYIGYQAQGFNNSDDNTIVIGANAKGVGANKATIGNAGLTDAYFGSGTPAAIVHAKALRSVAVTYANRPASPIEGMLVSITDASTATWGATIAGGGANHVLAYYNGTNWTVAGA